MLPQQWRPIRASSLLADQANRFSQDVQNFRAGQGGKGRSVSGEGGLVDKQQGLFPQSRNVLNLTQALTGQALDHRVQQFGIVDQKAVVLIFQTQAQGNRPDNLPLQVRGSAPSGPEPRRTGQKNPRRNRGAAQRNPGPGQEFLIEIQQGLGPVAEADRSAAFGFPSPVPGRAGGG